MGRSSRAGTGRDQLLELGSGRLVPGFEDQLVGASAGEERTVTITFPEDYPAPELAGNEAQFAVTVNEVKAKNLPEPDDDFASDATEFDTLAELREDIAERLRQLDERMLEREYEDAVRRGGGRRGRDRGAREACSLACARAARGHVRGAGPPGHLQGDLPADHRARGGGTRA